jgi:hypothetical protein
MVYVDLEFHPPNVKTRTKAPGNGLDCGNAREEIQQRPKFWTGAVRATRQLRHHIGE